MSPQKRRIGLVALAAVCSTAAGLGVSRVPALAVVHVSTATALDVQPFPGTPDASPQTEIDFPALAPAEIRGVTVTGSRSGSHGGRLIVLPGGGGSAFLPGRPFTGGERVAVTATLSSPAAGTASGAPGATRISFSFQVAVPARVGGASDGGAGDPAVAGVAADGVAGDPAVARAAADSNRKTHSFFSENWLHPPIVSVSGTDPDPAHGDVIADAQNTPQPGPLILDPRGSLIYFRPLHHGAGAAFNVQVQRYHGRSVLTYWQGSVPHTVAVGVGRDVILNHQYHVVKYVYAGHGYSADLHDFTLTPQGNALLTTYTSVRANLSPEGGSSNGTFQDSIIQEVNVATGKVLWEWHAYGHIPLSDSYIHPYSGFPIYDPYHINSVQLLPNGNLLVSAHTTWEIFEISMKTGQILFTIGGKRSDFRIGRGANFEWQHDVRMHRDGSISVFDNGTDGLFRNERHSRALLLGINYKTHTVRLIKQFLHNPGVLAQTQGSVQPLGDGNTFVGWGAAPYLSEYDRTGDQVFSLRFRAPIQSYRGFRAQWWGQPTTPPSIAAQAAQQGTWVEASWNGATTVASWRVLSGPTSSTLTPVGQYPKKYFETMMFVANKQPYFEVQALGDSGNVLGTSRVIKR